ncbi:MAG: hypothetical protein BWY60_00298 [Actinobacteria bacterium ADurb.Bin346]|nr:MAG: hypothetical protein BWY60_00298 [Actinobacteria bacterium ADurb.Bin346]
MEHIIPYGKNIIKINVPEKNLINFTIKSRQNTILKNEEELIKAALDNPVASGKLSLLASGKKDACILVSDITRPCPSYKFLPFLLKELETAGVKDIKIVFGLSIHRKHTRQEQERLVGDIAADKCTLIDSDQCRCRFIGTTDWGTPVEVFEEVLDSSFVIATGNIEYHYFAGYSGGSKALMPGVCSYNSVCANHSMMLEEMARSGEYSSNPVRLDIEQAGAMAGIDFIFNVILDDSKKIIGAVSGKNNEAFLEGIRLYDSIYEMSCNEKADIVLTSAGGYPKDINLYQAQKALENVKDIVKDEGIIILAAECSEGFGEDKFAQWMQNTSDFEEIYKKIKEKFVLGGHKAVAVAKLLTRVKCILCSCFDEQATNNIGFKKIDDIQAFLDEKLKENKNLRIAIVPNGRFIKSYC